MIKTMLKFNRKTKKLPTYMAKMHIKHYGEILNTYNLHGTEKYIRNKSALYINEYTNIIEQVLTNYKNGKILKCDRCYNYDKVTSVSFLKIFYYTCSDCKKIKKDLISDCKIMKRMLFKELLEFPNKTVKKYLGNSYSIEIIFFTRVISTDQPLPIN